MWFRDLRRFFFEESEALAAFTRQAAGLDDGATATGDEESEQKEDDDSSSDEETTNFPGSRDPEPQSSRLALAETAMTGGRQPPHHHGFLSILTSCCRCLAGCCMLCYVICPPVPSCIVRKLAFKPPKRGRSYKLVVTTKNGERKFVKTARAAAMYPKVEIHAILFDHLPPHQGPEAAHPKPAPVEGFIVHSKSGNHLVCAVYRTKHSTAASKRLFANKVALFAQPNSSDLGGFMQPFLPASFPNLAVSIGVDIYAFDYSGYGRSMGTPGERNMYNDIASVYEAVRKREGPDTQIILIGYSIGTAAVVDLASQNPPQMVGVVLIAPFASGLRLMGGNPRQDPSSRLDCLTSCDKISKVDVPVLICTGTRDQVTPMNHGQVLYERCKHKIDPLIVDGATHVSILNGRHYMVQLAIRFFIATDQHPTTSSVHDILHDAANSPIRTSADSTNNS
uniref:Hydrolase_4 domain-containing protein n=1 Tax=Panagrellus redivivus TaxID=6233 RepID=A0A7E4W8W9_PANRE